jgi:hypothetical protein
VITYQYPFRKKKKKKSESRVILILIITYVMANIIRRAKPGREWTSNELQAYNITIQVQDAQTFFGQPPTQPSVHPDLTSYESAVDMQDKDSRYAIRYMDIAMNPRPGEESAVADFTMHILKILDYESASGHTGDRILRTRKDIPLLMCGAWTYAKTDVCLLDEQQIVLLVQEDKCHIKTEDPNAQLIAEAIAAFQVNNRRRQMTFGHRPLDHKLIPGIAMVGTMPTFFKVPVTSQLVNAVELGEFPAQKTVVHMHIPELVRPARRYSEGMRPLDNRNTILACFEAFKQFVNWYDTPPPVPN